jgi:hypothetical protein
VVELRVEHSWLGGRAHILSHGTERPSVVCDLTKASTVSSLPKYIVVTVIAECLSTLRDLDLVTLVERSHCLLMLIT